MDAKLPLIRFAEAEDVPFILAVALEAYGPIFSMAEADAWVRMAVDHPDVLFLRSPNGFVACYLSKTFYGRRPHLNLLFLAVGGRPRGLGSEGYRLLKTVVECARRLGADFFFTIETEKDFTPLAKRLGAEPDLRQAYMVGTDG